MDELLKRFVELAPKEWGCQIVGDSPGRVSVSFDVPTGQYDRSFPTPNPYIRNGWVELEDDYNSADALVVLLDWLEEGKDLEVDLYKSRKSGNYEVEMCSSCGIASFHYGQTRIEAVLRAAVVILAGQKQEEGGS